MHYNSSRVDSKRKQFFVLDKQSVGAALEPLFLLIWLTEELVPEWAKVGKGGVLVGGFFWSNSVTVYTKGSKCKTDRHR